MVIITILLLAILFIAGLMNSLYYLPPKKLHSWFQSYFLSKNTSSSKEATSPPPTKEKKKMSPQKWEELRRVFATFDKNGDGFITEKELKESLKGIGMVMTEKDIEEVVEKLDSNKDGLIDIDEFCELYESMMRKQREEEGEVELKEAFDVFDGDRDGLITVEELGMVLSNLGLGKKIEDCKEMIRKVDMDGDGMVNFDEFKKMMKFGGGSLISAQYGVSFGLTSTSDSTTT